MANEAPERIWANKKYGRYYFCIDHTTGWTEYIRADLVTPPAPKVTREGAKVVGALKEGQYAVFHSAFPPHLWDGEKMVRIDLTTPQESA